MKTDTPPPVSEERLRELVEENDAQQARLMNSYGYTSQQLVEFRKMLDEIRDSRTTIAALIEERDVQGEIIAQLSGYADDSATTIAALRTSIREYMDMCEEYCASVVELTDLLTRVRADRDVYKAAQEVLVEDFKVVTAERDELRRDAGRYRWLRGERSWTYSQPPMRAVTYSWRQGLTDGPEQLDAAIDETMAAEVPHE